MEYQIILRRNNDIERIIQFSNEGKIYETLKNLYEGVWNIVFKETSDKLFSKGFWSNLLLSFKLMIDFKKSTHNKKLIDTYENFSNVYENLKRIFIHFNYWTKKDVRVIFIRDSLGNLVDPSNISLNVNNVLKDNQKNEW